MTDTVLQSFCERCGKRHTVPAPQEAKPEEGGGRLGRFGRKGGAGAEEHDHSGAQLSGEALAGTFHFCLDCRQYTCTDCWNPEAGACLSCRPPGSARDPASARAAAGPRPTAWPTDDLDRPSSPGTATGQDTPRTVSDSPWVSNGAAPASDFADAAGAGEVDEWGRPRTPSVSEAAATKEASGPSAPADDPWRGVKFSANEATPAPIKDAPAERIDFKAEAEKRASSPVAEWPVNKARAGGESHAVAAPTAWPEVDRKPGATPSTEAGVTEPLREEPRPAEDDVVSDGAEAVVDAGAEAADWSGAATGADGAAAAFAAEPAAGTDPEPVGEMADELVSTSGPVAEPVSEPAPVAASAPDEGGPPDDIADPMTTIEAGETPSLEQERAPATTDEVSHADGAGSATSPTVPARNEVDGRPWSAAGAVALGATVIAGPGFGKPEAPLGQDDDPGIDLGPAMDADVRRSAPDLGFLARLDAEPDEAEIPAQDRRGTDGAPVSAPATTERGPAPAGAEPELIQTDVGWHPEAADAVDVGAERPAPMPAEARPTGSAALEPQVPAAASAAGISFAEPPAAPRPAAARPLRDEVVEPPAVPDPPATAPPEPPAAPMLSPSQAVPPVAPSAPQAAADAPAVTAGGSVPAQPYGAPGDTPQQAPPAVPPFQAQAAPQAPPAVPPFQAQAAPPAPPAAPPFQAQAGPQAPPVVPPPPPIPGGYGAPPTRTPAQGAPFQAAPPPGPPPMPPRPPQPAGAASVPSQAVMAGTGPRANTRACPNCSLPLSAKARFCRRCGAPQP